MAEPTTDSANPIQEAFQRGEAVGKEAAAELRGFWDHIKHLKARSPSSLPVWQSGREVRRLLPHVD